MYLTYWLAALYVVAEDFRDLRLVDGIIEGILVDHIDELRLYRNGTFRFQRTADKHVPFHDGTADRLNWAEALHEEFRLYFEAHLNGIKEARKRGSSREESAQPQSVPYAL